MITGNSEQDEILRLFHFEIDCMNRAYASGNNVVGGLALRAARRYLAKIDGVALPVPMEMELVS